MRRAGACLTLLLMAAGLAQADLADVKAEPNPEKRSRAALENAAEKLREARQHYSSGDLKGTTALLSEVETSVELAETSLKSTGKNPVRSPKHFKHAELRTRELSKKLESFESDMNVGDREMLSAVKTRVQQVHDDMLLGVMGKKK